MNHDSNNNKIPLFSHQNMSNS